MLVILWKVGKNNARKDKTKYKIIRMPIVKAVIVALIIFIVINIIFVFESIYPIYTFYKMKYGINMPEPKEIERIYTSGSDYKVVEYFKLYYSDYEYERMINNRIFQEMDKTIVNEIEKCTQCPHCTILPDPEPYDWFCDDDVKLFCEKLKRTVAAALRPYESDEVDIPSDCPLE